MTRVDFYILPGETADQRAQFACRLAEKAFGLGNKVYIHTPSAADSEALDRLLWSFKDESFIPHATEGDCPSDEVPVLIGHQAEVGSELAKRDVLINMAADVPLFFSSFDRVAELIDQSEQQKSAGRERFKFYRHRGYHLETHDMSRQGGRA